MTDRKINNYIFLLKLRLKQNSPKIVIKFLLAIKNAKFFVKLRSIRKHKKLKSSDAISYAQIKKDLVGLGLIKGMKIMVHSSLSGLGYVEGGPATVIRAILDIVGEDGLVLMPSPPITAGSIELLRREDIFNPSTTPCTTGAICEFFRCFPGVLRSAHPTHSVAAYGKDAEWIVSGHHLDPTPFGVNSPFARLLELKGSILGMGLDVRWITFYHHFEDICEEFPINVYSDEIHHIPVVLKTGEKVIVNTPHHNPLVSSVRLNNDIQTLKVIDDALTNHSDIKRGDVGRGIGYLVSAEGIIFTLDLILREEVQTIYNIELIKKLAPTAIIK